MANGYRLKDEGIIKVGEEGMMAVLVGKNHLFGRDLPINIQRRVGKENTSIRFGVIEIIALIGENCHVGQDRESMCKTSWDKELAMVILIQLDGIPLSESRTILSQIDRHVKYSTSCAANKLRLRKRRPLEM